jgi:TatD DNase family protein
MLIDTHCHIDAYPQPALALAAGQADGVRTIAVTTSLVSYARTRILCRQDPHTQVALGLHPRRSGTGYDQLAEWLEMLEAVPLIGEVGLDFRSGKEENWATQAKTLADIVQACAGDDRLLMLHSDHAEAEVWDIVTARHAKWVIWHDYRADGPKSLLYRAIEAGHFLGVGPDAARDGAVRSRLRAVPREQILTETNGPWSRLGTGNRAAALQEILATLAETWRCTPREAEAQVERNYTRLMAGLGTSVDTCAQNADQAV